MPPHTNELKSLIASFDWPTAGLPPVANWPQSLRTTVDIVTASPVAMVLLWGADGIMIYNDAYADFAGSRHPHILGKPVLEGWHEVADFNRRVMDVGLAGETLSFRDKHLVLNRRGVPEDAWLSLDYSPVVDETGKPAGVLAIVVDTTPWVHAERAQRESESRFRTLADNIAQFAWMAQPDGSIFWYNKRWFDYTGTTLEEMKGWGWRAVHHPAHVDRVVEKITECFRTGEVWEDTFPLRAQDGSYRWFLSRAMPISDEGGLITRWLGTNPDITNQLADSQANTWLATIVNNSADAIFSLALDGTVLSWNPGAARLPRYAAEEVVGKSERIIFPETADDEFREKYEHLRLGQSVLKDTVRRRKDGTLVDVAINAAPMEGPDGRIFGVSAVMRDITERKLSEDRLRLVMRELSHRTKNLLAVIVSMVRQTARNSSDIDSFQQRLSQRLQALAASQDLLVAEDWAGASLEALVQSVLRPFVEEPGVAIKVDGPHAFLNATAVQNIALALHELATNAAKYGALSRPTGQVSISWSYAADDSGEPRLRLVWQERGGPLVDAPTAKGFGHVVIERVAAQALNGEVKYTFAPEGVEWSILIPPEFAAPRRRVPS
jgi:PAS domain S-box-containing protein